MYSTKDSAFDTYSNQANDLYDLDVQVSQFQEILKDHQVISMKCQEYIAKIGENLKQKYQSKENLQVNTNKIHSKKKWIRKIQGQKNKNLIKRIKKHKQNLNSLWALRLFNFFKSNKQKDFDFTNINSLKNQMVSASNINQLASVFRQNPWVHDIIIQNDQFLNFINQQKISDQSKLLLFQTFDILLEGIKDPETLVSWDNELNHNNKKSKQLLMKLQDKTFKEIHELVFSYRQRQKEHYKSNKCSNYNNITYFWFKYVKDIFESQGFRQIYQSHQIYQKLKLTFLQSPTIGNIRNVLSVKQLAQYIFKTKIEYKQILSELLLNYKLNLLNKINMLISLNKFIDALRDPSVLDRWNK